MTADALDAWGERLGERVDAADGGLEEGARGGTQLRGAAGEGQDRAMVGRVRMQVEERPPPRRRQVAERLPGSSLTEVRDRLEKFFRRR